MTGDSMRLLVAVINDPEKLDEILSGFLELGITGATIVNSEGMGSLLSHDIPIFAGLQTLISGSRPQNRMLLSVVPAEIVEAALALLQDVVGNLSAPATGIAFTLPVDRVVGLAPQLGGEGSPI
jgi:nitrogen regulatory protein PII